MKCIRQVVKYTTVIRGKGRAICMYVSMQ